MRCPAHAGFLSVSGYYAVKTRPPSPRAAVDAVLGEQIRAVHEANYGVYGVRKMHATLRREGLQVGRDRVARLMRHLGLQGVRRGRQPTARSRDTAGSRQAGSRLSGLTTSADPTRQRLFGSADWRHCNVRRMAADVVEEIARAVASREAINGIRIIGVDGPSGAGKSHLASRLAARLSAPIVAVDDFVSWGCLAGWWPRFDTHVLTPLLAGKDAVYQARDWSDWYGSSLGEWKTQPWSPTVIFEGVTCTRRDTVGRIAYAIWVEAPASLRLSRGLARDRSFAGAEHLWRRWMIEEDRFFTSDATRDRADVIIDTAAHGSAVPQ